MPIYFFIAFIVFVIDGVLTAGMGRRYNFLGSMIGALAWPICVPLVLWIHFSKYRLN